MTAEKPVNRIFGILETVRETFGLSMEAMIAVCRVQSINTLYSWRDGVKPHKHAMKRLFELNLIASAWRSAAYPVEESLVRMSVVQGKSVMDLLCTDRLNKDQILFAGGRLTLLSENGQAKENKLF